MTAKEAVTCGVIKCIIGLGNPGAKYQHTRHNIGFGIVDELAARHAGSWQAKGPMHQATIMIHEKPILLIKPDTYMNDSGRVLPVLKKQGISLEDILVVHDELELPFGTIKVKKGGSHKGHNGLRSIMAVGGPDFCRLRFGIGRPKTPDEVPDYVLAPFLLQEKAVIDAYIAAAADHIEQLIA